MAALVVIVLWAGAAGAGGGCEAAHPPAAAPSPARSSAGPPAAAPSPSGTPRPPFAEPPFTAGDTVYNVPGTVRLAAEAFAPLGATGLPTAVRSPDSRYLIYRTWAERGDQGGRPSLRLKDFRTGLDTVWADGGNSVAWGADNRIAYVQGGDSLPNQTWTGRVFVRTGVGGTATAWTDKAGRYHVVAWAGRRLLAYRELEGEYLEPLVFDGPDRVRELPDGFLVAISPDGSRAVLSGGENDLRTRVVDLASGRVVAAVRIGRDEVVSEGDWSGDHIVVGGLHGLVVLRLSGRALTIERTILVGPEVTPFGPYETTFVDAAVVVSWVVRPPESARQTAALRCELAARSCVVGPAHPERSVHPVRNPSRPVR